MIKFFDTHFEDYIITNNKNNLHPELNKEINKLPNTIEDLNNIIYYGKNGIGKYTQVLKIIEKYSPSSLKYEKKITITCNNKTPFCFKISDVHFEIDMSLLGCNSKLIWHDIYNHIIDIIHIKPKKVGIIVLKYFHKIHNELLDIFYSYMQNNIQKQVQIIFFIITEHISFLPDNILHICKLIPIKKPNNILLKKSFSQDKDVFHLKDYYYSSTTLNFIPNIYQTIITELNKKQHIHYYKLRDYIYELLIYDLNISKFIWYLLKYYSSQKLLKKEDMKIIIQYIQDFFLFYNNNYRPIYHIELLLIQIVCKINNITKI
jgi:hypothetical protein